MSAFNSRNAAAEGALVLPRVGEVYDAFAALERFASEPDAGLGGCLIAVFGLGAAGLAALVAGSVAGAAVLGLDADRERGKQLLRYGICDFVVNDLDEAVRILKNEVRRNQPVSVCLPMAAPLCAREMVERGLQPEVLAGERFVEAEQLRERGAVWLEADAGASELVEWRLRSGTGGWAAGPVLAKVDQLAAEALAAEAQWRRRWLKRSARYLGRRLGASRCVRMNAAEAVRLVEAVRQDRELAGQVMVARADVPVDL